METLSAWIVDLAILLSLGVTTLAVIGLYRFEDPYLRLHAVSNATFVGVVPLFVAVLFVGDFEMIGRAAATIFFLIVVLPVSIHAMGRARYRRDTPELPDD